MNPLVGEQPFPRAARTALRDEQLRANLRHATHTIRDKRARIVSEVEDWQRLRAAGSAVKADVLARLPELLVQFESAATAAGAATAARSGTCSCDGCRAWTPPG